MPATFGESLRSFRLRAKLTQKQLGDAAGWDFTYVSKLERPDGPVPGRESIERAAEALGLTTEERYQLLQLASKVPTEVERMIVSEPAAVQFFGEMKRRTAAASKEEQEALWRRLTADLDRMIGNATADAGEDAERPYRHDEDDV
jgi:transcriptional regulator with XRE-family HTH domain